MKSLEIAVLKQRLQQLDKSITQQFVSLQKTADDLEIPLENLRTMDGAWAAVGLLTAQANVLHALTILELEGNAT